MTVCILSVYFNSGKIVNVVTVHLIFFSVPLFSYVLSVHVTATQQYSDIPSALYNLFFSLWECFLFCLCFFLGGRVVFIGIEYAVDIFFSLIILNMLSHRLLASITFVRSLMLIVILVYFCDRFFFFLLISKFCFAFYLSFPNLTMIVCLDMDLLVFFLVEIYWSSWICRFDFSSNLCNFWQVFLQIYLSVLFCLFLLGFSLHVCWCT